MPSAAQLRVPATYMRGGTSKGVFFLLEDLPAPVRRPGAARDAFMRRVIGSPDPYAKHTDGMGGATSSTSKVVIISGSARPGHDVNYLFGQVAIEESLVDWSGNCGNLVAAVGPFAVAQGLVAAGRAEDRVAVRIWQENTGKTIVNHVPVAGGLPQETGDFELDGVTFPAAEIGLDFMDPADADESALFPTGELVEQLEVPGVGPLAATLINAGIPTIFVRAEDIGFTGRELQQEVNEDAAALARLEAIRAAGAVRMGLVKSPAEAAQRQHTPKLALVAPGADYLASSGRRVLARDINLLVRGISMGKLHHAMMGTVAVATGAAAAVPGTLVNLAAGGGECSRVRFGHPSGSLQVGAEVAHRDGVWRVHRVSMARSARVLMEGWVRVPAEVLPAS